MNLECEERNKTTTPNTQNDKCFSCDEMVLLFSLFFNHFSMHSVETALARY